MKMLLYKNLKSFFVAFIILLFFVYVHQLLTTIPYLKNFEIDEECEANILNYRYWGDQMYTCKDNPFNVRLNFYKIFNS
jgi:hypothetical protein